MSSPAVISGNVVEPAHISQPHSYAARDFFNSVRDLIHAHQYHNESERLTALASVDGYEKHVTGADQRHVVAENDRAPIEDVSLRVPPNSNLPQLAPAAVIDYGRLAAAIVAAQAAQAQAALPSSIRPDEVSGGAVPDITSMGAVAASPYPQVRAA